MGSKRTPRELQCCFFPSRLAGCHRTGNYFRGRLGTKGALPASIPALPFRPFASTAMFVRDMVAQEGPEVKGVCMVRGNFLQLCAMGIYSELGLPKGAGQLNGSDTGGTQ